MDAIAVTFATKGSAVGLAPLGTSLTDEQAAQLHALGRTPVIATDADHAGRAAAERDYWMLTPYGMDPLHAELPDGSDPADLVASGARALLAAAICSARPLANRLIDEILGDGTEAEQALDALRIVAARPAARWASGVEETAEHSQLPASLLRSALVSLTRAWNEGAQKVAWQIGCLTGRAKEDPASERSEPRSAPNHQSEHLQTLEPAAPRP